MPTIGAITVGIYNHYDHTLFPEFPYPSTVSTTREREDSHEGSRASVYIPSVPSTRFFVRYAIQMPFQTSTYLYFKLFINGRHITSWGINPRMKARGHAAKAFFTNQRAQCGEVGDKDYEVRSFMFAPEDSEFSSIAESGLIEVKVFRSSGRTERSIPCTEIFRHPEQYSIMFPSSGDMDIPVDAHDFDWELIDPKDSPLATFRFYHRTWSSLKSFCIVPSEQPQKLLTMSPSVGTLAMYIQRARQEYALDFDDEEASATKIEIPVAAASMSEADIIEATKTKLPGILKKTMFAMKVTPDTVMALIDGPDSSEAGMFERPLPQPPLSPVQYARKSSTLL